MSYSYTESVAVMLDGSSVFTLTCGCGRTSSVIMHPAVTRTVEVEPARVRTVEVDENGNVTQTMEVSPAVTREEIVTPAETSEEARARALPSACTCGVVAQGPNP